jgi:ribosomal 50S subunit-recycling heat shock protein
MRLDKFLALSGLVRRRTKAQEACDRGYVALDGVPAKPARPVRPGQELTLRLGGKESRYRLLGLPTRAGARAARDELLELLEVHDIEPVED